MNATQLNAFFQKNPAYRTLAFLMGAAMLVHVCAALAAALLPELADEPSYKIWANRAVDEGIHRAYSSEDFGYDWLPFYLYLSKGVGLAYRYSGLADYFGPYSRVLTLLLKVPMILLNLLIGWLVYRLTDRLYGGTGHAIWATAAYLLNPAIGLATDLFGYQDALHTALVFLAVYSLCTEREHWAPFWAVLGFLTKPQAAIFLLPVGVYLYLRKGARGIFRGAVTSALTAGAVLLPFIVYGQMGGVFQMYLNVPRIHQWLTGCAHNIWWVLRPVPPFYSDRTPLLFGLNGLTIGLLLLAGFSAGVLFRLIGRSTPPVLIHTCAFLGFVFFMVVTEIHENHLYAMFPFLAIFTAVSPPLRRLYVGLTVTFALDMILTLWLLNTDSPIMLGPIRVSVVNALANVAMLGIWSYLVFFRDLGEVKIKK